MVLSSIDTKSRWPNVNRAKSARASEMAAASRRSSTIFLLARALSRSATYPTTWRRLLRRELVGGAFLVDVGTHVEAQQDSAKLLQ